METMVVPALFICGTCRFRKQVRAIGFQPFKTLVVHVYDRNIIVGYVTDALDQVSIGAIFPVLVTLIGARPLDTEKRRHVSQGLSARQSPLFQSHGREYVDKRQ
ncbi:hypothetical protein J2S28_005555 [Rhizobium sp. SLBN-94]|nr:hypothetical protein [Rhizobium sp. SLBN-94]